MKSIVQILAIVILLIACMGKKDRLVNKAESLGYPEEEILVTLEDFFVGNDDQSSIGPNIYPKQPSLQEFYRILKEIRELPAVEDVFVRIADIEAGSWPFSDAVYIISETNTDEIALQLKSLKPDNIYDGWMYGVPTNAPVIHSGSKVYTVWWD